MIAACAVRKDELLLRDVDDMDVVDVDDKAPPETKEFSLHRIAQLVAHEVLNLAELKRNQPFPTIKGDYVGIVALRLDIDKTVGPDAEKFRAPGQDDMLWLLH